MRKVMQISIILAIVSISLLGCENKVKMPSLTTKKLIEFYPSDLFRVSRIDIRNGSTGEMRSITDTKQVHSWINKAQDMEFKPDPNQQTRTGYLYAVDLYEGDRKMFSFTNNQVGDNYYIVEPKFLSLIRELFEQ